MSRSVRQESPARYPEKRQERRVGPPSSESGHSGSGPSPQQQHLEGVLRKYTNLLQGWQNRYFVLDHEVSRLDYYRNEHNKSQRPPRGSLSLLGARVVSAGDFPYMFVIQSPTGEAYKLRASNAAEQELWMTKLQLCSRCHSYNGAKVMTEAQGEEKIPANSNESLPPRAGPVSSLNEDLLFFKATSAATLSCLGECFTLLHHSIRAHNQNQNYHSMSLSETPCAERVKSWNQRCSSSVQQVEPGSLKSSNESPIHSDSDKQSPKHCSYTRRQEKDHNDIRSHADCSTESTSSPQKQMINDALKPAMFSHRSHRIEQGKQQPSSPDSLDPSDETTDTEDNDEEDLGVLDEQRSIIRHLLSQLKLGMDLTKVALPTFILEKRSLLEMYANFMAHPDMFLSITTGTTSEERIIRFVEYYLTAFHEGRKGAVAKKPYNPILGVLHLLEHNEDYVFTLPCAYARSILAVPWVELGGKVTISCAKTGYSATVTFHTKPFYGGKVHRVTAEVKHNQTGNVVCKVQGEWNGVLEFTYSNGESKVIDTSKLPVIKKKIRPIEKQEQNESRRLWQHVTASLRAGRMDDAAEHKHRLEERQRIESKQRSATKTPWTPKHFIKEGDGWVYHNPLGKVH
ncbi:oxysterol-binding protein-related protein 10-like isoform X3 [Hippocampus zosterae]|uniref:oxysterol-binding protein-related protein 10-like isoform X3 n=1 Tax=Hippocampus zosterae TaxID=109293 RepID=UPI00223DE837|nr:oxysterol-binding protein-related protein 10-like isoform X3 [Hippocampus zosterae]